MQSARRVFLVVLIATGMMVPEAIASGGQGSKRTKERKAQGAAAVAVTLEAAKSLVPYGGWVKISGAIEPAAEGERVEIFDAGAVLRAAPATDAQGEFSVLLQPKRNWTLHAEWSGLSSDAVRVRVQPKITVSLGSLDLFGKGVVKGRTSKLPSGTRVTVTLKRWGARVARKTVPVRDRRFTARFYIRKTGEYLVSAKINPDGLSWNAARSEVRTPYFKNLSQGARGKTVRLLEKRLIRLGYYLPKPDRVYDAKTSDAVIAFNKVQRTARVGYVNTGTWKRLSSPKRPRPKFGYKKRHFEIDQTRQVVFVVKKGKVRWILHTSTGADGATHDGTYTVNRKLAGYSPNRLYYPSYWHGGRAFHGWPEVPTYPASHGCARLPMWMAIWMYGQVQMGDPVHVYH